MELLGTKAEIKLRKADASSWKYLFSSEPQNDKQTDSIAETTAEWTRTISIADYICCKINTESLPAVA